MLHQNLFFPKLLILAAHVVLHATLNPTGKSIHITASFADMSMCKLAGSEIVASAPEDDIDWTCTARWGV